jgi:hypothetical protein
MGYPSDPPPSLAGFPRALICLRSFTGLLLPSWLQSYEGMKVSGGIFLRLAEKRTCTAVAKNGGLGEDPPGGTMGSLNLQVLR